MDSNLVSTPIDLKINYVKNKGDLVSRGEYAQVIGCLIYAMTCTLPDIAYVVGIRSRYTSNPSKEHWEDVTRILKYLKGTKDYGICYCGNPVVLEGYSGAS